jgi:hypothetical protein
MQLAEAQFDADELLATGAMPAAPSTPAPAEEQQNQQALAAEIAQAKQALETLTGELRGVDGELEELAIEREQHRLLGDVCNSLDRLYVTGGAALFWGENTSNDASVEQVRCVRERVAQFEKRVKAIEARRADVIDRITQQQSHASFMEDVLFEALEEEERRQQEWIVEREISKLPAYKASMPWTRGGEEDKRFRKSAGTWTRGGEEDKRFRKSAGTVLLICLLFALIVPHIPLPERILKPETQVPERIVRLLIESHPKPQTPTREPPKPKPEEKLAEQKPKEMPKVAEVKPQKEAPQPAAGEGPKVAEQGILAFREKFSGLQEDQALARLGSKAQINNSSDSGPVQRSMLTTNAPGSSGGINLASLSRGVGGSGGNGGMAGVQVTRVSSGIGGIGKPGADRPLSGDGVGPGRTDEEIQIVFDRYKAALYRLYNKELRKDPTLRGQMVLHLTIEPDGSVSMCALQASDMNAPELSAQVVDRVKTINFGAKEGVPAITILYPIDFLPAA